MKTVMKMYVEKGSILPGEERQAENNQTKWNRTSKKDLPTYLTTKEKVQWEEVAPRNHGKRKGPPEKREQRRQTPRHPPQPNPSRPTPEMGWNLGKEQQQLRIQSPPERRQRGNENRGSRGAGEQGRRAELQPQQQPEKMRSTPGNLKEQAEIRHYV